MVTSETAARSAKAIIGGAIFLSLSTPGIYDVVGNCVKGKYFVEDVRRRAGAFTVRISGRYDNFDAWPQARRPLLEQWPRSAAAHAGM
jgi:hypothetical protein